MVVCSRENRSRTESMRERLDTAGLSGGTQGLHYGMRTAGLPIWDHARPCRKGRWQGSARRSVATTTDRMLMSNTSKSDLDKYPATMRVLHWLRAIVVIGVLGAGLVMVNLLPDELPAKFEVLYPNHKQ